MRLQDRDKKHLWHPLTQHKTHPNTVAIKSAKGAMLYDEAGKAYIDGIASWYTCMYGHCNEFITDRVSQQLGKLDHVVFSGFTHCLLYTSPSPRDATLSRMPSSA